MMWLTFHIDGVSVEAYGVVRERRRANGWVNLGEPSRFRGTEYPKKGVANATASVRDALAAAIRALDGTGMEVVLADADTARDPASTTFGNRYGIPAGGGPCPRGDRPARAARARAKS